MTQMNVVSILDFEIRRLQQEGKEAIETPEPVLDDRGFREGSEEFRAFSKAYNAMRDAIDEFDRVGRMQGNLEQASKAIARLTEHVWGAHMGKYYRVKFLLDEYEDRLKKQDNGE